MILRTGSGQPRSLKILPDSESSLTAASTKTLNFINHSLNHCLESHLPCRNYQLQLERGINDNWPKRILKIDADTSTVRLVDFEKTMRSRYVAFSYCWGSLHIHFKATQKNFSELREGFEIARLPATLVDAIKVTVGLGSSYIWIDSVCIIQDSRSDWNEESVKMSTVYAQSLVTLIAASASSCGDGFLEKKREQSIEVGQVNMGNHIIDIRARIIYDWGHHRGGPQAEDSSYRRWIDPVDCRGWTLQERLLSGRYINFTSGEVQWGCLAMKACECKQELYGRLYKTLPPEEEWFAIVEEFATRKLTKSTDKMVAMAGIARNMSTKVPWKWYGSGIWLSPDSMQFTTKSLLWKRNPLCPLTLFYEDYVAPSFSWASISTEVTHLAKSRIAFPCQILALDTPTEDPFGPIAAVSLTLQGPFFPAKLSWISDTTNPSLQCGIRMKDQSGYFKGVELDGPIELITVAPDQHAVQRRSISSEQPDMDFKGAEVFLLPIAIKELEVSCPDIPLGNKPHAY